MLLKLAWRNLWRNKRRSIITIGSIVFAVVLSILLDSVKKGLLDKMKENLVGSYTGYVQVHQSGYWDDQSLENSFDHQDSLVDNLLKHREITGVIPRLESFVLASSGNLSKGVMAIGVDPQEEMKVAALHQKVVKGQYLEPEDQGILVGEGLADYFQLAVGDSLVVIGQGYQGVSAAGIFHIKGLVRFGSPELNKRLIYFSLPACQQLFGAENRITALALQMENVDGSKKLSNELAGTLSNQYEVMSWQEMLPELDQVIQGEEAENVIFQVILYLLIAFGIFGTVLMMTLERQYEFGVLVAIGMKKTILTMVVVLENILLSILGAVIGIMVSVPVVFYFYVFPINIKGDLAEVYESFGIEPIFYFSVDSVVFYTQGLVVLILALVLAFYPVIKIYYLNPVRAMQS